MTAALECCEWSAARPGRTFPRGMTRYPFYRRLGGRAENLVPTGIRSRTVKPVVVTTTELPGPRSSSSSAWKWQQNATLDGVICVCGNGDDWAQLYGVHEVEDVSELLTPSRQILEASWNVEGHAQKPDFRLLAKRTSPFKSAGDVKFSRLLAAEVCASAVVMLDTPCSGVVWGVLATHSIRQFPLLFPSLASTCAITFQLESARVIRVNERRW